MPLRKMHLTACGCKCSKCYCTEVACNMHPHCFGQKCDPIRLLKGIGINWRNFRLFVTWPAALSPTDVCKAIIRDLGKYTVNPEWKDK